MTIEVDLYWLALKGLTLACSDDAPAAQLRLPAIYEWREFAEAGGLNELREQSNGCLAASERLCRPYLDGANPAGLHVLQSTKFEFVINLKTAKRGATRIGCPRRQGD
jgi:hypothetical protein